MSSFSKPSKHLFRCPVCGHSGHNDVSVQRPNGDWVHLKPLQQCSACTVVFGDPTRFSLRGHMWRKSLAEDIQRNNHQSGDY